MGHVLKVWCIKDTEIKDSHISQGETLCRYISRAVHCTCIYGSISECDTGIWECARCRGIWEQYIREWVQVGGGRCTIPLLMVNPPTHAEHWACTGWVTVQWCRIHHWACLQSEVKWKFETRCVAARRTAHCILTPPPQPHCPHQSANLWRISCHTCAILVSQPPFLAMRMHLPLHLHLHWPAPPSTCTSPPPASHNICQPSSAYTVTSLLFRPFTALHMHLPYFGRQPLSLLEHNWPSELGQNGGKRRQLPLCHSSRTGTPTPLSPLTSPPLALATEKRKSRISKQESWQQNSSFK